VIDRVQALDLRDGCDALAVQVQGAAFHAHWLPPERDLLARLAPGPLAARSSHVVISSLATRRHAARDRGDEVSCQAEIQVIEVVLQDKQFQRPQRALDRRFHDASFLKHVGQHIPAVDAIDGHVAFFHDRLVLLDGRLPRRLDPALPLFEEFHALVS
jgi:hypothetical protein